MQSKRIKAQEAMHHATDGRRCGVFKGMADEVGVPYQSFIKLDSRDCLANHRKVQIKWLQAV